MLEGESRLGRGSSTCYQRVWDKGDQSGLTVLRSEPAIAYASESSLTVATVVQLSAMDVRLGSDFGQHSCLQAPYAAAKRYHLPIHLARRYTDLAVRHSDC